MDDEKMRRILLKNDKKTLEDRIKRQFDLDKISIDATKKIPPRLWMYLTEADIAYVDGLFNSSIFCSIQVVDQIMRHEYVKLWGAGKCAMCKINEINDRVTFGQMKDILQRVDVKEKLSSVIRQNQSRFDYESVIKKLDMLNEVRNKAVVHPLYFDFPNSEDPNKKEKISLIKQDLETLLVLVDKKYSNDTVPFSEDTLDFRGTIADIYLQLLALKCHEIMREIVWVFYKTDD